MRIHRLIVSFFVLAIIAAAQTTLPFTTNSEGMVHVPAEIGGVSVEAVLDTGAGIDLVAPSVFKKMKAQPAGIYSGFRMSGERLDIALYTVSAVRIGSFEKKNVTLGVLDVLDKVGMQAIIGMNDLQEQPFTIDFVRKKLVFETQKSLSERRRNGSIVPLRTDEYRGIVLDLFAEFTIGNASGLCEIDSGDPGTAVNTRFMDLLGIDKGSKSVEKVTTKSITGAERVRYKTTVPQLAFKTVPDRAKTDARVAFSDIIFDCVVGLDFYADKVLTFDIARRELIVGR